MMYKQNRCWFILLSLFLHTSLLSAQDVQWAKEVIAVSSEFIDEDNPTQYRAVQALGKPNVLPAVFSSPCAWSPSRPEARQDEWIWVKYETPMFVRQIAVGESFGAGAISAIYLYDEKGKDYLVYKNNRTEPYPQQGRMFNVILKEKTKYKVASVKVKLNTIDVPGWNHIDAIGLSGSTIPVKAKINVAPNIPFNEVERLPNTINSPFNEILPVISPDGNTLFFDRKDHPKNTPSYSIGRENDDIWFSRRLNDNTWTEAERLPSPLNNGRHNYVCSVTPDGNMLLLANAYLSSGEMDVGVSVSIKSLDGSWAYPEPLRIENFYNTDKYAEFCLSSNRKVLLMAVRRSDTYGSRDLYVSFLQHNNTWSEPRNLGSTINTAAVELTPMLAPDNRTLYFASQGHSGYGSADMFVSKRLDDTWTKWSEPQNLGNVLNSEGWDTGYSVDASGEYVYFASAKNTAFKSDIYRAKLHKEIKPDPTLLVSGTVYNSKTKEPIAAEITYEILPTGEEVGVAQADPNTGKYKIALPPNGNYGFLAKARGFISVSENIDAEGIEEFKEIERDLYLTPIEVGQKVRLNNVFFERGKAVLLESSYPELNRLVAFLKENTNIIIEVEGHTDIEGSPILNMKLSAMRVDAIKDYLIAQGIDEKRIVTHAYGSTQPITRQRDEESKQKNRRVEFKILSF